MNTLKKKKQRPLQALMLASCSSSCRVLWLNNEVELSCGISDVHVRQCVSACSVIVCEDKCLSLFVHIYIYTSTMHMCLCHAIYAITHTNVCLNGFQG